MTSAGSAGTVAATTATEIAAAMASPAFYGEDVGAVEVRETHISRVFLVGSRAYKLKKPVSVPFLEASTATRRHELCREELRLNRPLAPDVYLAVRAVVASDEGFRLAEEDASGALDYVVEMRRYDERETLSARLADGRIRRTDVTRVARRLAKFHASAPRVVRPSPVQEVERWMAENLHELIGIVGHRAELDRILELEQFVHSFVIAHSPILAARASEGFVREVHGDLRAEHVVLGRRLQVVDCIEFDRRLREIDVADDLAFLVMDLTAGGGGRFASALVPAYRDAGGDPGPDWLIAFYASYRALVRAKVALLRAAQYPAVSHERAHQSVVARDLIALAETFAWRARLPLVIVVCGVPAVGKSSLAQLLAGVSGLSHISSDITRKRLAGLPPDHQLEASHYSTEANERTYTELARLAVAEAAAQGGVVVDATFRHRADREAFVRAFGGAAPVLFIECRAPAAVVARRAAKRDRAAQRVSDATAEVAAREIDAWDPLDEVPAASHMILRSDLPVEMQLADVTALIDRRLVELRRPHAGDAPADLQ